MSDTKKKCPFMGKAPEGLPVVLVDKAELREICGLVSGLAWMAVGNMADALDDVRSRLEALMEVE